MLSKKNIVVTIGNYGAVVALHDGSDIKNKIFLDELNDKTKEEIKSVFLANKSASTYILVDTVDQIYKKKVYPLVRRGDLTRLVKRDMASDGDTESFKNYIVLNRTKSSKKNPQTNNRWECLFVSASNTETISHWLEFLLEMPNRLVGIYMLPVESFQLLNSLKKDITARSKVKNKRNDLHCLIMQNKVSGTRQVVFSNGGIVFTRLVNYDFAQADFLEKYEQDLYSTFEYLKRLFPDVLMSELDIINILPSEAIEEIKKLNSADLNFVNYTPSQAAAQIGESKILPSNSASCDLLISRTFSKGKKLLKFSTAKIASIEKFFIGLQISKYLSAAFVFATVVALLFSAFSRSGLKTTIATAKTQKFAAIAEFSRVQQLALEGAKTNTTEDGEALNIEKVTDFGKMEEALGANGTNISDFYSNLKFLKNYNVRLNGFSYTLNNFNQKSPTPTQSYKFNFKGKILNKSGDIEDLFAEFDSLVAKVKENLNKNQVTYTDLPRNIDFNQKYYEFPIDFTVSK
ncbi:MAG: hypothetical protein KA100_04190 [Rickettsiales bacterium]|nr:hypothetical protein [Rickettsiales bacterium]